MRLWILCLLACACGSEVSREPKSVVDVPLLPESSERADPPRRDDTPPPESEPDLLSYYVGTWDGLVNDSFPTELRVDSSGRFFINSKPHPKLPPCHLAGRLEARETTLGFVIEESSCKAEKPGSTLERTVTHKTKTEFKVNNEDSSLIIRYTRRAP